ncbi:hypothetical protein OAV88_01000 [bacterium]|nr:hypothetical protein [bacterium]
MMMMMIIGDWCDDDGFVTPRSEDRRVSLFFSFLLVFLQFCRIWVLCWWEGLSFSFLVRTGK